MLFQITVYKFMGIEQIVKIL